VAPAGIAACGGCGAFVSLHLRGRLRGCVGVVASAGPLATTLARSALSAAFEDSRFPPLTAVELPLVEIELSLLSPLRPIAAADVLPGVHGLLIRRDSFSGLLLPQVATRFQWTRERFLAETCHKAGLDGEAWQDPRTEISAFTAEVFSEGRSQNNTAG
jgi:AmmeMemoRadiSam system protein A